MFTISDVTVQGWASGVVAVVAMLVLTPLVIRLAHRRGWVAHPKADRWHSQPTALMGGLAIYGAAVLSVLLVGRDGLMWPIALGASVMFVTGLIDDRRNLKPGVKLVAQVVSTALLIYGGYLFGPDWPPWVSIPLTFFWVIGITNAMNLLDNMDGLAAGIAAIAAGILAVFAWLAGATPVFVLAMAVAGAAAGFLFFNFKPARIFMGDGGSLFLGYTVAALAVAVQGSGTRFVGIGVYLVSTAVLAVPIFDTTLVTIMRILSGRAVSQGGRDHSSHRLVFMGLSEAQAVVTLYGVSLVGGLIALLFLMTRLTLFVSFVIYLVVGLGVFGVYLASVNVYKDGGGKKRPGLLDIPRVLLGRNWKVIAGIGGDLLLIIAAFISAYHLRFENGITPRHEAFIVSALPVVVVVKVIVFYVAGLYRSIWRHAGTPEIVRIGGATIVASLLSYMILGVMFGFNRLSRGVFFIDWMVVTLAVTGVRLGFRGLRQYISSKRHRGKRVFLYGAGDAGLLSLRELRQNPDLDLVPVGFIDDDSFKKGLSALGLPVMGAFDDLPELCRQHHVEEILITAFRMTDERKAEVKSVCEQHGIGCRIFNCTFVPFPVEAPLVAGGDGGSFEYQA